MKIWELLLIMLICFSTGYGLRMYQHPIHHQTEAEQYEAVWYREYIESYLPADREKEPEKLRTHIPINPELIQKGSG